MTAPTLARRVDDPSTQTFRDGHRTLSNGAGNVVAVRDQGGQWWDLGGWPITQRDAYARVGIGSAR